MRTLLRSRELARCAMPWLLVLTLVPHALSAQTVLLREGDLVPDTDWTITSLGNTAVGGSETIAAGGNAVTPGAETLSFYAGNGCAISARGNTLCLLRSEQTIGVYQQVSFESFYGINAAGEIAYSPSSTDTVTMVTGLDGVWLDDAVVMNEEQVYQNDNSLFWSFGSRPTVTENGIPFWVGGLTDTQGGSTQNRGLFTGFGATPLVIGGGMINGLPDPVSTASAGISFDYRVSSMGSHWIAEVGTVTGSTTNDNAMVIDGSVALSDGTPVSEGTLVPVASGGDGTEAWDNFDFAGITESGTWMITGDTDGNVVFDEFIAIDGVIVHREGDLVDGAFLTGAIEGAYMNENGDYAYIWDVAGDTQDFEALFFEDRLLLVEGEPVDWDGDGTIDMDTAIDSFTGISTLTMTDRDGTDQVRILCTVDVEVPIPTGRGTQILEGFLSVTVDTGPVAVGDPGAETLVALEVARPVVSGASPVTFDATLRGGSATLEIFDVAGRRVKTLLSGAVGAGTRRFTWDGTTDSGMSVLAGVYWARLESSGQEVVTRVTRVP